VVPVTEYKLEVARSDKSWRDQLRDSLKFFIVFKNKTNNADSPTTRRATTSSSPSESQEGMGD
jgi:hypothetical protein